MTDGAMSPTPGYGVHTDDEMTVPMPDVGVSVRTVHRGPDDLRIVVFAFAEHAELAPHDAPRQALIEVRSGELELRLGDDTITAPGGTWVRMDAGLTHAVRARTPSVMVLTLLPG